jgi:dolichyl-diphosphooligosaccharide--protein glycosyltransferase
VLFGFVAWVVAAGEVAYAKGTTWLDAAFAMPIAVGLWLVTLALVGPSLLIPLDQYLQFLQDASLGRSAGIGETFSLFGSLEQPLLLFGLVLVVAVPTMVWVANELRMEFHPGWIALSAYAWVFLALSVNRVRFTGMLALFTAIFAAVGIIWLAGRMEQATPLTIFRLERGWRPFDWKPPEESDPIRVVTVLGLVVLLITGIGVAQTPSTMDQITVDDSTYEAATWMDGYSTDRGWDYPRNYVFSEWGSNRVYNYHVSGESKSYGYAQRNYRSFVSSSEPGAWYEALAGGTGFVVVRSSSFEYPGDSMQVRLFERHGSAGDGVQGLAHYRLVYVGGDGELKVFTLVPGATIVGTGTPNSILPVSTEVRIGQHTFTYRRNVRTDSEGRFSVTVAYPGAYAVGSAEVTVSDTNVTGGDTIRTGDA